VLVIYIVKPHSPRRMGFVLCIWQTEANKHINIGYVGRKN